MGFYNAVGAVTIGNVWKNGVPNLKAAHFASGTMAFKILFSDAKSQDFKNGDLLAGAPEWTILTNTGKKVVRLMQMDVAAVDPRSATRWVFGTFAYQTNATDKSHWRRLRPVGLSWGNDPGYTPSDKTSGKKLTQTIISDQIPAYAAAHLGWAGRANGPVDNPKSGCLSCHGTAQYPVAAPILPPGTCKSDAQKLYWFRNINGTKPFGAVNSKTCEAEKTTNLLTALDFSLQMQVAIQSVLQYKNVNSCHPSTTKALRFAPNSFMNAPRVHR